MNRLAAEPEPRPIGPPRLRLEPDVGEGVVLALEARGRVAPTARPRRPDARRAGGHAPRTARRAPRTPRGASSPSAGRSAARARGGRASRAPSREAADAAAVRARRSLPSLIRVVAAAIAESSTSELGQGVAGSWFPGSAYARGLAIRPASSAPRPRTTCSLIITTSKPASSAITAISTSRPSSRGSTIVQFSERTRTSFGLNAERRRPATRPHRRQHAGGVAAPGRPVRPCRRTDPRPRRRSLTEPR